MVSMKTELSIQSIPVERGRIAAKLKAESSADTIALAESSAEVMCRFVGTAVAPYFIVPDTEHMQQVFDMAQVYLPELRIHLNRILSSRDPIDASDAQAFVLDKLSMADSAQAIIIRPYDWIMMNMLKHAENLQASIAGLYPDIGDMGFGKSGRILGQAAFDLTNALFGITDEEFGRLPSAPGISDFVGKSRRAGKEPFQLKGLSHIVVLSVDFEAKTAIALIPRKAGGAFVMEIEADAAMIGKIFKMRDEFKETQAAIDAKKAIKAEAREAKKNRGVPEVETIALMKAKTLNQQVTEMTETRLANVNVAVKRVLRFGLFYRSGSAHYLSPLKELVLLRLLVHYQKLLEGERPYSSNYRYYEAPRKMISKIQSVFLRVASDTLITATGDLSDYLSSEDGTVLLEGANLAYGFDSMPLFISLLACSDSIKTLEQMLLLSQQGKGGVQNVSDVTPPVALEPRFVRWVAEVLLNPVLEYRNEQLAKAGIPSTDIGAFVTDPSFVNGGPDLAGITGDNDPAALRNAGTIFGLDRMQLASITELIRLEIGDLISGEESFIQCLTGKYSKVPNIRYNGRFRDLDHLKRLIESHAGVLRHIVPAQEQVLSAATLPYRQISFSGPYSAYEFGRTILPIQYGVYDLAARISRQLGEYSKVSPGDDASTMVDIFAYIDSSILRYEPRYMFPFYIKDGKAGIKRVDLQSSGGRVYALTEGAEWDAGSADGDFIETVDASTATRLWVNTAPFAQQYREVGLVTPCWDVDTFELLSNLVDLPTDRTYFPAVKPNVLGGRISMTLAPKKLDEALQRMLDLEYVRKLADAERIVSIDKLPALASIGVIMPFVPKLAHDLKASWMDDFAMVDIDGGIYATAGTIVMPRDAVFARATAGLAEDDAWRCPTLDNGFSFKNKSAPYHASPLNFDAE